MSDFIIKENTLIKYIGNDASVNVPDGVERIADSAFMNCHVVSINIPCGVTEICERAFRGCYDLTSVTLPDGLTVIGDLAFSGCSSLKSLTVPDSVISIGDHAFCDCIDLRCLTLGSGVETVEGKAFSDCLRLETLTFRGKVPHCKYHAFAGCNKIKSIYINDLQSWCERLSEDDLLAFNKYNYELYVNGELAVYLTVPEGVSEIADFAFYRCGSIETVILPGSVRYIGYKAFGECDLLDMISMHISTGGVFSNVFTGCKMLRAFRLRDGAKFTEDCVLYSENRKTLLTCAESHRGEYTVPDHVTAIGENAFRNCIGLTGVTVPEGVNIIRRQAFFGCDKLERITLPEGLKTIESGAFRYCRKLTEAVLPNGLEAIDDDLFYGCEGLSYVSIPESVKSIGICAFFRCKSLTHLRIPPGVEIRDKAFSGCENLEDIEISPGARFTLKAFDNCAARYRFVLKYGTVQEKRAEAIRWLSGDVKKYDDGIKFKSYISRSIKPILEIIVSGGLTGAFYGLCRMLGEKKIDVFLIDKCLDAAKGNTELTAALIEYKKSAYTPEDIEKIETDAAEKSLGLKKYTVGEELKNARETFVLSDKGDGYAVKKCKINAAEIFIPELSGKKKIISIEKRAFSRKDEIRRIDIPGSVKDIKSGAFAGCSSLSEINVAGSNEYYRSEDGVLFTADMKKLVSYPPARPSPYVIPAAVKTVGEAAFAGCRGLKRITIPGNVSEIGPHAFIGCSGLKSLTVSEGAAEIGHLAFKDCYELKTVILPRSLRYIGKMVFERVPGLVITAPFGSYACMYADDNGIEFKPSD